MSLQGHIIQTARFTLGVTETGGSDGHSGNIVPYWDWWKKCTHENGQGQSWCACWASWVFAQNNASNLIAAKNAYGFIYCPDLENYGIKNKRLITDKRKGLPGDLILFDWDGQGIADHVEIIQKNLSATSPFYLTVGANTSGEGVLGSQKNGGGVYERHRHIDSTIRAIYHPPYPMKLTSLVSTADIAA